jgi:hemolysin III
VTLKLKDPLSGLTHFFGILLAVAGMVVLLVKSAYPRQVVGFAIYGAGTILMYTFSTIYHWLPLGETGTRVLRKLDHAMIFVCIASVYTPITLIVLRGAWGWTLFGLVWGIAVFGIVLKSIRINWPRWLSAGLYVIMGWIGVVAFYPLLKVFSFGGFAWLLTGGLAYTIGAVIYSRQRPDPWPKVFGFHEIFHVFILLGSFCHFVMMYKYVLPL